MALNKELWTRYPNVYVSGRRQSYAGGRLHKIENRRIYLLPDFTTF